MTVSEKVDALQKRVADLKSSFEAARTETNEQVRDRITKAKADAARAQDEANAKAAAAADKAQSRWAAIRADVSAKVSQMQEDIDRKRDEHDVKAAQRDADNAEDNALDALFRFLGRRSSRYGRARCDRCQGVGRRPRRRISVRLTLQRPSPPTLACPAGPCVR